MLIGNGAQQSLQAAVEVAREDIATARAPLAVVDPGKAVRIRGHVSMLISLHVFGPAFRCESDKHGRSCIRMTDELSGEAVVIVVDEPSLASLCEAVHAAARDHDVEAETRRLIELGREYERMLASGQDRADRLALRPAPHDDEHGPGCGR
jgi:hypothetical protein